MTDELWAKLAGRRVVASVSGGKDSAALSLWLTEQGIEHDRVFCDTGWEHDATYEYLRGPLHGLLSPVDTPSLPRKRKPSGTTAACSLPCSWTGSSWSGSSSTERTTRWSAPFSRPSTATDAGSP